MAVYCGDCAKKKQYPRGSIRAGGEEPCQFCGGVDSIPVRNRRTGATETRVIGNFSYPDNLLPDNPENINNVRDREQNSREVRG